MSCLCDRLKRKLRWEILSAHSVHQQFPFDSSRWWLDRPRVGWLWVAGDHERHHWANVCHLPGPHLLPARRDSLGLRVPSRSFSLPVRQIRGWLRFFRQSSQDQDHAYLQSVLPAARVPEQRWRDGVGGHWPREDTLGAELQGEGWGGPWTHQCSHK